MFICINTEYWPEHSFKRNWKNRAYIRSDQHGTGTSR